MKNIDKLALTTMLAEVGAVAISPDFREFLTANVFNLLALAPAGLAALRLLYAYMPVEHPVGIKEISIRNRN